VGLKESPGLRGCLAEGEFNHGRVDPCHDEPLGSDGPRLEEELGPDEGEGKLMSPQSASSPGVDGRCHPARSVRSLAIPWFNEISSLTIRAIR
jgi:hypothetical protein